MELTIGDVDTVVDERSYVREEAYDETDKGVNVTAIEGKDPLVGQWVADIQDLMLQKRNVVGCKIFPDFKIMEPII